MLSLVRKAVIQRRGVKPIHPLTLNPAIWLDPTDASTLFVDEAGTQPVVFGDPVGRFNNKGTAGALADFVQPVSAERPLYIMGERGPAITDGVLDGLSAAKLNRPFTMVLRAYKEGSGNGDRSVKTFRGSDRGDRGDVDAFHGSSPWVYWRRGRQEANHLQGYNTAAVVDDGVDFTVYYPDGKSAVSDSLSPDPMRDTIQLSPNSVMVHYGFAAFNRAVSQEDLLGLMAWMEAN